MNPPRLKPYQPFDYGLSAAKEERAARLHAESLIIDILYQGPLGPVSYPQEISDPVRQHWEATHDGSWMAMNGMSAVLRAAADGKCDAFREHWLASGVTGGNRDVELHDLHSLALSFGLHQKLFDTADWIIKALKAADFRRAKREGKAAGYLSTQLTSGPFPSLDILRAAHGFGLRMAQLTYNSLTTIGSGCTERTDGGVSHFGVQAIALMNELGIIVDTGHCGKRTTLDACEISRAPVVASHTGASKLHMHDRSKSDEEIRAIAKTGGVVGVLTVPFFLSGKVGADVNVWLDHVDHIANLVGVEHVGVGTDWPVQQPKWILEGLAARGLSEVGFRPEHNIDPLATLVGFSDYLDFSNITRGLVARGYSDQEVAAVLGGNFLRIFQKVCG